MRVINLMITFEDMRGGTIFTYEYMYVSYPKNKIVSFPLSYKSNELQLFTSQVP